MANDNNRVGFYVIYNKIRKEYIWYTIWWNDDNTTEYGHTSDINEAQVWKGKSYKNAIKKYCKNTNYSEKDLVIHEVSYTEYMNWKIRKKEYGDE